MIDPTVERVITLREVGRICAPNDRPLHVSTIWRWAIEGRGRNRVRLEIVRVGGRVCTSREALARFLAALNPELVDSTAPVRTPAARQRAARRAGETLRRAGV